MASLPRSPLPSEERRSDGAGTAPIVVTIPETHAKDDGSESLLPSCCEDQVPMCYICFESTEPLLYDTCKCKTATVHAACLVAMVRARPPPRDTRCFMCRQAFAPQLLSDTMGHQHDVSDDNDSSEDDAPAHGVHPMRVVERCTAALSVGLTGIFLLADVLQYRPKRGPVSTFPTPTLAEYVVAILSCGLLVGVSVLLCTSTCVQVYRHRLRTRLR